MDQTTLTSELLTVDEAAKALALKPSTLRKWIHQKRMPCVRIGQRAVRAPARWVRQQIRDGWREARSLNQEGE